MVKIFDIIFVVCTLCVVSTLAAYQPLLNLSEDNFTSVFPIVCTKSGCVEGIAKTGYQVDEFEAFFGIPYAEPPIGNLRFANPVSVTPWTDLYNAKTERMHCIQKNFLKPDPVVEGVEDCLYLNVYRPKNVSHKNNSSLPVMVYIHEGGFFAGSIHTLFRGPHYFMDTGEVILVLMTYRLGVMGFLSTNDDAASGNFGLKDQNLALRWIKDNIEYFGGDSNSITIFGASAGGVSVQMHMMSPYSRGLFNRAICMSGLATAPFNEPTKDPLSLAKRQAEVVGIDNIDSLSTIDLIEKLRQVNASLLVDSIDALKFWSVDPLILFRPIIERNVPGSFFTRHPVEWWESGDFEQVPWMTGITANDGDVRSAAILTNKELLDDLNFHMDKLLIKLMEISPKDRNKIDFINERMYKEYLNGSKTISAENFEGFQKLFTDRAFIHPLYKTIQSYLKYADTKKNPVYLYKFSYKGSLSYSSLYTGTKDDFGVGHLDDLIYLFRTPVLFPEFKKNSESANLIRSMTELFVSFAMNGRPTKWNHMKECTNNEIDKMCDYKEIRNEDGDKQNKKFEMYISDNMNMDMISFWDNILSL